MDSRDEVRDREICMAAWDGPDNPSGAVAPPVYQTSLFAKPTFGRFVAEQAAEHENPVYSRGTNPTVAFLEERLALLERGEAAKCFASGMGAIAAVLAGTLKSGDHVLFVNTVYGPTLELAEHLRRFGVEHTVLPDPPADIGPYIRDDTALIYLESPGTMLMRVLDLPALAAQARRRGIRTVIDNTWATPLFQKPLTLGVDLAVHSCTKYIGGHSDVVGGVLVGSREAVREVFYRGHQLFGAAMSAMEAALVLRGLRTLPVRMAEHRRNAAEVVQALSAHPRVAAVHHPAAAHGPDEALVRRQFRGYSGLLSFELKDGSFDRIARFMDALSLFRIGVSWGGYESLATSPQRPGNGDELRARGLPPGLVRLSVGLEGAAPQIADLERALAEV
ncbi:aminotransferase class I/II-fold pyridoxal phosphate-dependent enzyme [Nocardiopsis sp. RSe5-2]|uniref:Aminotransferase class I/II-fold pyridoxal phosphate-dependent enzyme n=1 Tax=Nocardiopsis endophytica TaxID=3018445 RepID=A0ABT4U0M4_9ACTN|nr:aminotransferase class I/II-fold pyridoxal phosphate-dependent enzyme [Nocardiopsis endophytica]MDA2810506.1 aminotransferase class I/II-fold pyridoxal phosphate-dependent enzyme [Nocardiopsis endophytica]